MPNPSSNFVFESQILEAFKSREQKKSQWSEGLHHIVPHEHVSHISLHHQHAQYHLILFWIENLFTNAARWLGVRELARLSLDYLENSTFHTDNVVAHAEQFIEVISKKNSNIQVAQLEALMRCGLACWKVRSAPWISDQKQIVGDSAAQLKKRVELGQMAFVESLGEWSIYDLWQASVFGRSESVAAENDVWVVMREDELSLSYERWSMEQFLQKTEGYRL